ncbi:CD59 glycoprotein isoform X1 [Apus apus]|uniref:CD59 glycoprotein isoform X1 n=2 Tax=Apus apus TaxID=8895 RepID=UPI0021F858D1|nr:CD59 glycoprotein isoform X1 [Apus apus]
MERFPGRFLLLPRRSLGLTTRLTALLQMHVTVGRASGLGRLLTKLFASENRLVLHIRARSMIKMNHVLLTTCVLLVAFCSSGYALRCYHCENSPTLCKTNSTCLTTEDTCLQMKFGKLRTSSCWKASQCNINEIAEFFQLDNFEFFCCQHDLCNEGTMTGVNKAAFSIASVMAMLWLLL